MVRRDWLNLNGLWDLSLGSKRALTTDYDKKILVPFPVESSLSGVGGKVDDDTIIRYRRTFDIPARWQGNHILLHFGAVDWATQVKVNGKEVGSHNGGYDPFTFDITSALQFPGPQTIEVAVEDPTDRSWQPRGKQVQAPEGIFYTSSSGIWQTVWIEPIPKSHIDGVTITPDLDRGEVRIRTAASGSTATRVFVQVLEGAKMVAHGSAAVGQPIVVRIPSARLWSPASPFLYKLEIDLAEQGRNSFTDRISSYFGMRKISVAKDRNNIRSLWSDPWIKAFGPMAFTPPQPMKPSRATSKPSRASASTRSVST